MSGEGWVLGALARLAAPGGEVTAMWSILPRDGSASDIERLPRDGLTSAFHEQGLSVCELRPASPEETLGTGSTWAKRLLGGDPGRPVTLLRATKR